MSISAKKFFTGVFTGFLNFLWHDNPAHKRTGPGAQELERPTVQDGNSLRVVFGTADIPDPCVAWFGDVVTDKINENSRTSNYRYTVGMHFILCAGNADKIVRVRVDEKDVYNTPYFSDTDTDTVIDIDKANLFGGYNEDGGVSGRIRFRRGLPSQGKNSYLANAIYEQDAADAPLPAFRGVTAVIAEGVYIGTAPYLKKWDFRIQRIHYAQNGTTQWYDAKSAIIENTEDPIVEYDDSLELRTWVTDEYLWTSTQLPIGDTTPAGATHTINTTVSDVYANDIKHVFTMSTMSELIITGEGYQPISIYLFDSDVGDELYPDGGSPIFDPVFGIENADKYKIYDSVTDEKGETGALYDFFVNVPARFYDKVCTLYIHTNVATSETGYGQYFWCDMRYATKPAMNPVHIIRECLVDDDWGLGYSSDDIDSVSFEAAADTIYTEKMGISTVWNRNDLTVDDFIAEMLGHIDAKLYVERSTGEYTIKLIRDDYTVSGLPHLNESNIKKITNFKRTAFGDMINSVCVKYTSLTSNTTGTVLIRDDSSINAQGSTIQKTIEYMGFTNPQIATVAARRELLTLSTPLTTMQIEAFKEFETLRIGDAIRVSHERFDIDDVVYRVNGIVFPGQKDRKVTIDAVEDIFTLPDRSLVIDDAIEGESVPYAPASVRRSFTEEIPYYLLKQIKGSAIVTVLLSADPDAGFVCAAAPWPDLGNNLLAELWTSADSSAYAYEGEVNFCPFARIDGDLLEATTAFNVVNMFRCEYIAAGEFFSIGAEIMQIASFDNSTGNVVAKRGMLDTVAAKHIDSDTVVFWHSYLTDNGTEYTASQDIDSKYLVRNNSDIQSLNEVSAYSVEMDSRAIRPYLPGNLKVNTEYFPEAIEGALALTWAHRDRTSSTLSAFGDASVTTEAGVTYTLRVYDEDDVLILTETGITAAGYTYSTESGVNNSLRFELESVRSGYTSFYMYNHTVNRAGFGLQFGRYFGGLA